MSYKNDCGTGCGDCCPTLETFDDLERYNETELKPLVCTLDYVDVCRLPEVLRQYIDKQTCFNSNLINVLRKNCETMWGALGQLYKALSQGGKIEIPRKIVIPESNNRLITPVDLGNITNETRIGIGWRMGSTVQVNYFTVDQLKNDDSHITAVNFSDAKPSGIDFAELFTKIRPDNKLWATTVGMATANGGTGINAAMNLKYTAESFDSAGETYHTRQNPDYAAKRNGQDRGPLIEYIIVYDLVEMAIGNLGETPC